MYRRILHCGVESIGCSKQCGECVVRFKCYTEQIFYPLIVTRDEFMREKLRVSGLEKIRVGGKDGELRWSVKSVSFVTE